LSLYEATLLGFHTQESYYKAHSYKMSPPYGETVIGVDTFPGGSTLVYTIILKLVSKVKGQGQYYQDLLTNMKFHVKLWYTLLNLKNLTFDLLFDPHGS
jgi:hypothetical protein